MNIILCSGDQIQGQSIVLLEGKNIDMSEDNNYKDPKDLRNIPLERLRWEGNREAHQFGQWNDFFNIESAMRRSTDKSGQSGWGDFSELERLSIFSNRYLLMEREHLSDYKLFDKREVLKMIESAYNSGFQDGLHSEEEKFKQHERSENYMEKMSTI